MTYSPVRTALRAASWALVAVLVLAACGQKGPLVLPGRPKDTPWPAPPAPAPQPDGGAATQPPGGGA